jgi:hypothetical protein
MTKCATQAALNDYMSQCDRESIAWEEAENEAIEARIDYVQDALYSFEQMRDAVSNFVLGYENEEILFSSLLFSVGFDEPKSEAEAAERYWRMRREAIEIIRIAAGRAIDEEDFLED